MRNERKWRDVHEAVLIRLNKERPGFILFRLKVTLYPLTLMMEDPADKCSDCRSSWSNAEGAMNHAHGVPHFRQWCVGHPGQVRDRFPEAIEVTAEATLTEVLK